MISSTTPIRVMCVDDNHLVAEGVRLKLEMEGGLAWAGHLSSADDLVSEAQRIQPDVVLLDIDMPGRNPFDALREMTALNLGSRVIMFSGHVRSDLIDQAVEAGAWGYVSKNEDSAEFVSAIHQVAKGKFALGPTVMAGYQRP